MQVAWFKNSHDWCVTSMPDIFSVRYNWIFHSIKKKTNFVKYKLTKAKIENLPI